MPGFPCGNNPHHQMDPGDRAVVDQFRDYLTARTEEKTTVNDLENARAALRPFEIISGFVDDLRRFEAAVRANEHAKAETRRLGTPFAGTVTSPPSDRVTAIYDALSAFQDKHRIGGGLGHAQIRALLAEHLDQALPTAVPPAPTSRAAVLLESADVADEAVSPDLPRDDRDQGRVDAAADIRRWADHIEQDEARRLAAAPAAEEQPENETPEGAVCKCPGWCGHKTTPAKEQP